MGFDYNSILLASGAAGVALGFTLIMSWLRQRRSAFLLTWAVCIAIVIVAIVMFSSFQSTKIWWHATVAGVLLNAAYALNYGGMIQFRDGKVPLGRVARLAVLSAVPIVVSAVAGFDGLSFILINLIGAILLGMTAHGFWNARAESPVPIGALGVLHLILSASYLLCALVMATETPLYLNGQPPDNWAEVLNLAISVVALSGIGGLFVTVHQERISRQHLADSLIDPLTGLHNRRALAERYPNGYLGLGAGLVVFDLDDFKGHNDRHGHAFGDMVLRDFAELLLDTAHKDQLAVRLGGEEFVLILPTSSPSHALAMAERVRGAMGRKTYGIGDDQVTCTVSAGVAMSQPGATDVDTLIGFADSALYLSKRKGRNRVSQVSSSAA